MQLHIIHREREKEVDQELHGNEALNRNRDEGNEPIMLTVGTTSPRQMPGGLL
jgi:hypothetical protein